ncbi:PTS sugar transporter subunit IIA [Bacillus paramycoides]|uniref:PTS sugar transporter subunit IIA n=1 Tax=Bacillus paramycoides TaxID=2026194 RepID=UPI002242D2CD|nr:PTS sugar transporter subunit IIA [Bacillus paramycoides]MCW9130279.1 PTS sugar transporter subunit IIA [Bacillus paramycoides]
MDILILSHAGVASGLKKATQMILGEQKNLHALELTEENGITYFSDQLQEFLERWGENQSNKLLIFADLKGGTPFNQAVFWASKLKLNQRIQIISGVNLPIVIEAIYCNQEKSLEELSKELIDGAKNGIDIPEMEIGSVDVLDE